MKLQIPSSKLQRNFNIQTSNPDVRVSSFGYWSLVILWSLELGAWNFINVEACQ